MISCSHWGLFPYTPTVATADDMPKWFADYLRGLRSNAKPHSIA